VTPPPERFTERPRAGWVVGREEMTGLDPSTLVIDARAGERYRGETEPIDPRAGHIPGAVNLPFAGNLTGDAIPVFRPADELHARFAAVGADRNLPVVYCGSGVTSCHDLLALHAAGLRGRLYAGSWSEWSADPSLPIATGDKP
jgi:thiosulfate/3-mercaptopyruvate sulfurtransferase